MSATSEQLQKHVKANASIYRSAINNGVITEDDIKAAGNAGGKYSYAEQDAALKRINAAIQGAVGAASDVNLGNELDLQNEAVKSKQRDILNKEIDRQELLKENIENDKVLLAKLEKDLEQLKAGKDVDLRQGTELMQQNNVPEMQKYLDMLNKTDENKSFWNFKPAEV